MKKYLLIILLIFLSGNICIADETSGEIKLDLNSIPSTGYARHYRSDDVEDQEFEEKERQRQELQEQGQDQMYRQNQQMMTPMLHATPLGGFMY